MVILRRLRHFTTIDAEHPSVEDALQAAYDEQIYMEDEDGICFAVDHRILDEHGAEIMSEQ